MGCAVEVELARLVEQLVGVADQERSLIFGLTGPSQRVQDSRIGLLELDGDLFAPLLHLRGAEDLLGPHVVLNQLDILAIAEGHHLGTLLEAQTLDGLTRTEGPRLIARDLDLAIAAQRLDRGIRAGHAGAFAADDQRAELLVRLERCLVEVALHLLPARDGYTTAQDGGLTFGRRDHHLKAVLASQLLGEYERFLQEVGATLEAQFDIRFLAFNRLAKLAQRLFEGLGRSFNDLLCRGCGATQQATQQQHPSKKVSFHGIIACYDCFLCEIWTKITIFLGKRNPFGAKMG